MFHRRAFLFAAAASFLAVPAHAGLRERLAARREERQEWQGCRSQAGHGGLWPGPSGYLYARKCTQRPVFIHVHGGGWRKWQPKIRPVQARMVHEEWLGFFSIDYRLLPQAPVTTQANDVETAFSWVKANIGQHGGDPSRIAVSGHSAGCHLVALTGCRGGLARCEGAGPVPMSMSMTFPRKLSAARSSRCTRMRSPILRLGRTVTNHLRIQRARANADRLFARARPQALGYRICRCRQKGRGACRTVRWFGLFALFDQSRFRFRKQ